VPYLLSQKRFKTLMRAEDVMYLDTRQEA